MPADAFVPVGFASHNAFQNRAFHKGSVGRSEVSDVSSCDFVEQAQHFEHSDMPNPDFVLAMVALHPKGAAGVSCQDYNSVTQAPLYLFT